MTQKRNNINLFIGWQSPVSGVVRRQIMLWTILLLAIGVSLSYAFIKGQNDVVSGVFEYGNQTDWEGIYVNAPVPMLKISEGAQGIKSVILTGLGKVGAENTFSEYELENNVKLENKAIKIRGTAIRLGEIMMLELTDGIKAILEVNTETLRDIQKTEFIGDASFYGEIYDPKCAFGVMNPGYGKVHRSCAVRCISGGIPPVLAVKAGPREIHYILLRGPDDEPINHLVLDYVADFVRVCGKLRKEDDWYILRLNSMHDIVQIQPHWMPKDVPLCAQRN